MEQNKLTLGSLFDGSGGFPLGGLLSGITPVWASEIEPFPIRVTTKRLPFMKHYGDVSKMDGADVEPVDIITFGSPCQDMSIAGRREGLDGSRSSLFYEAVRIVKEMRCATDGKHPRYIVWENVPGAFSSNKGADFQSVLEEICSVKGYEIHTARPERWPAAGEIVADDFSLAWRVFDAQYWGVPQRRKRIYLVADFAGGGAGKILFESEGVSGYTPQGFRPWQGTAGTFEEGAGASGCVCLNDQGGSRMDVTEDVAATLRAENHGHPPCVMGAAGFCTEHSAQARGIGYAVMFIESLCHTKGTWAGKPFELIDWQEQIIRDLFGVLKPNGYRQFNTAYIEIPKKQGKSELAAAVALLLLCGDGEERAEVYGCAADRNQAKIVFDVAVDMVRFCPALSKRVKILESQKKITYLPTNSSYQVLSADVANKHGFNTHGVIFDELHTQPNRKLFDVMLQGSGDARMQPLYFLITTAGNDTNSICYEVHQKAIDIAEGRKVDPTFYSVIYGAAENEDWTDPKVWKKANPSLGITVGIDKVRAACESARQNPGEENAFRQLRLNQWVKQSVRWMPMDKWDACAFPVSEDDLEGRICYGGLDLSSTTDITAFVLVFPPLDEEDKYYILPYFWIPEETLDLRVRRDHVPYDLWERQGTLMTTEGNVVHYGYIEKFIEQLGERFNIREIAFDRWGAVQMVQNLEGMGFTVVPFGQGFKDMSPPTKELMKLVLEERIAHGGHPVLRWMMDNIYIRTDPAGNIKADKEKSTEKIDGAIATIMGLDRAIRCGNDTGASVYDSRGLLFI